MIRPDPRRALLAAVLAPVIVLAPLTAAAQDDQPPPVAAPQGTARAPGAMLRGLDKITGAVSDLPVKVGDAITFGRLSVRLGECRYPQDDPGSDAFAELTITDKARGSTVFAGWMVASSPALSAMDDARYDIWVVSCDNSAASGKGPDSTAAP